MLDLCPDAVVQGDKIDKIIKKTYFYHTHFTLNYSIMLWFEMLRSTLALLRPATQAGNAAAAETQRRFELLPMTRSKDCWRTSGLLFLLAPCFPLSDVYTSVSAPRPPAAAAQTPLKPGHRRWDASSHIWSSIWGDNTQDILRNTQRNRENYICNFLQ